jgi:hypothetical protein
MFFWFIIGVIGCLVVVAAVVIVRHRIVSRSAIQRPVSARSRGLFRFSDGVRVRSIDPIEALMGFEKQPQFLHDKHPRKAQDGDLESLKIVAEAVRLAFGIPEFTEVGKPGLTVRECFELYCVFSRYLSSLKKSTNSTPTSQQDSAQTSNRSDVSTTSDMSASGSTESELGTSKPLPSSVA